MLGNNQAKSRCDFYWFWWGAFGLPSFNKATHLQPCRSISSSGLHPALFNCSFIRVRKLEQNNLSLLLNNPPKWVLIAEICKAMSQHKLATFTVILFFCLFNTYFMLQQNLLFAASQHLLIGVPWKSSAFKGLASALKLILLSFFLLCYLCGRYSIPVDSPSSPVSLSSYGPYLEVPSNVGGGDGGAITTLLPVSLPGQPLAAFSFYQERSPCHPNAAHLPVYLQPSGRKSFTRMPNSRWKPRKTAQMWNLQILSEEIRLMYLWSNSYAFIDIECSARILKTNNADY